MELLRFQTAHCSARRSLIIVVACMLVFVGCGGKPSTVVVGGDGASTFPFETMQDWKSYGDLVAVVHIESEAKREDSQNGGGFQNPPTRYVTASVERTLWSRQDAAPKKVQFLTDGWIYDGDELVPTREKGQPRVEVGGRYLISFIRYPSRLEQGVVAQVDGEKIVPESPDDARFQLLAGLTVDQLDTKLAATSPDPIAAKNADLAPRLRYEKVEEAARQQAGPTTPEN